MSDISDYDPSGDEDFVRPSLIEGYEYEQCGIRQTHPEHQWGKVGGEPKMCEGLG